MKKLLMLVLGAVFALAAPLAHADSLNQISFAGSVSYAAANPGSGYDVTFSTPPSYPTGGNAAVFGTSTGIFSAFTGATATSFGSEVIFNNFNTSTAVGKVLFTATAPNGQTVSFTITSDSVTNNSPGPAVTGTGYYTFVTNGVTTTVQAGSFAMTAQGGGTSVSFSDTNTVTPEPSSLVLLGTGLVSAAGMLVRRRRRVVA